jgi:phosphate transport system ATP-binding protein
MRDATTQKPMPFGVSRVSLPDLARNHHDMRPDVDGQPIKIDIRDLDFFYGTVHALKRVSVPIHDRAITALIGPSGCGKSTLLRILNRVFDVYPDQRATGEVLLDGVNILRPDINLNSLRRRIGMTFQKPNPLPMSIYENIAFGIRLHQRLSRADLRVRVEKALREAALWDEVKDILHRRAYDLSGGQQQRLCIARAIALDPEILLFDEPCSALDPLSTLKIEDLLNQLARRYCVVIVTHNMQQAARVSDFVAFMYLGEIVEFDTSERIFVAPRDPRTEAYVTGRFG